MAEWHIYAALLLAAIPIVAAIIKCYFPRGSKEDKDRKRQLKSEIKMYSNIANGNNWNWLPNDVDDRDSNYRHYRDYIDCFISYLEFVDDKIQPVYREVVKYFTGGYSEDERAIVWKKYFEIREFSKTKARELGEEYKGRQLSIPRERIVEDREKDDEGNNNDFPDEPELLVDEEIIVEPGDHKHLDFRFIEGDNISGIITEVDDDPFNFYLFDEENYANFREGDMCYSLIEYDNKHSISIKVTIPYNDRWYFVFELYGKQYPREINVRLDKVSSSPTAGTKQ